MNKMKIVLTMLLLGAGQLLHAHPGHGVEGHDAGTLHPMLSGEHVVLIAVIGIAALLLRGLLHDDGNDGE
ncbi:MAG: hypothetical protein KDJ27_16340 [Gammaproteobacteria bacterium]|nr:hypothetical protein [Gammaproteobacteria bacterium]MCB1925285.1 hypothetical protein [Gammaproteobacteria bacterium]